MRKRTWVAGLVVAVVAVGLVGAATYVSRYQPLTEGGLAGVEAATSDGGMDTFRIPYRDRTLFHGIVSVRNEGRFTVRVEQVAAAEGAGWRGLLAFRPDRNGLHPPNDASYDSPPFQPFDLPPGEERWVSVAVWMDNCERNPRSATVREVPVRFRLFGMARTQRIRMSAPWVVTVPPGACPRTPPGSAAN